MHNSPLSANTPGTTPLDHIPPEAIALDPGAETFGERLARLRKAAGMTQAGLAERLGVSMTAICYWEQDRSRPKHERIEAIAAALDATPGALLEPSRAPASQNFQHLVARARIEIANAAGIAPAKVKIVIEI